MTHKQVLFGSGAREKILRGVGALADEEAGFELKSAELSQLGRAKLSGGVAVPGTTRR